MRIVKNDTQYKHFNIGDVLNDYSINDNGSHGVLVVDFILIYHDELVYADSSGCGVSHEDLSEYDQIPTNITHNTLLKPLDNITLDVDVLRNNYLEKVSSTDCDWKDHHHTFMKRENLSCVVAQCKISKTDTSYMLHGNINGWYVDFKISESDLITRLKESSKCEINNKKIDDINIEIVQCESDIYKSSKIIEYLAFLVIEDSDVEEYVKMSIDKQLENKIDFESRIKNLKQQKKDIAFQSVDIVNKCNQIISAYNK